MLFSLLLHGLLLLPALPPPSAPAAARLLARLLPRPPALPYQTAVVQPPRPPVKPSLPLPAQVSSPPAALAPAGEAPVAAMPLLPQASDTAVNADGLREYRISLARSLLRQLSPAMSDTRQGSLELGVAVSASGRVDVVTIVRGSGDAELDRQILAALHAAVVSAELPVRLHGQGFVVYLPVEVGRVSSALAGR